MELPKLIRQLQEEKCPPRVLDKVAERIARDRRPVRSWQPSLVAAVSIACLLGVLAVWQWQARRKAEILAAELAAEKAQAERALVVQQAYQAFGYFGQALLRAAAHTENTLSKEAVPPLRNGFETVKNKVTNPI